MSWDSEDYDTIDVCPVCGTTEVVPPFGNKKSPVLLVGEFPGQEEIEQGRPFVGPTGNVLRAELRHKGMRLSDFRIMNLWQHEPNGNPACFELGVKTVLNEAKGRKLVVLIGSDTVGYFTGRKVNEWNGLTCYSDMLGEVFVMVQPASVFHGGVGELRFALRKLFELLEEISGGAQA